MSHSELKLDTTRQVPYAAVFHAPNADLNDLIKRVAEELLPILGEEIRLRLFRASGPLPVALSPDEVEGIIGQFFIQAKEEMQSGGVVLIQTAHGAASHVVVTFRSLDQTSSQETSVKINLPIVTA